MEHQPNEDEEFGSLDFPKLNSLYCPLIRNPKRFQEMMKVYREGQESGSSSKLRQNDQKENITSMQHRSPQSEHDHDPWAAQIICQIDLKHLNSQYTRLTNTILNLRARECRHLNFMHLQHQLFAGFPDYNSRFSNAGPSSNTSHHGQDRNVNEHDLFQASAFDEYPYDGDELELLRAADVNTRLGTIQISKVSSGDTHDEQEDEPWETEVDVRNYPRANRIKRVMKRFQSNTSQSTDDFSTQTTFDSSTQTSETNTDELNYYHSPTEHPFEEDEIRQISEILEDLIPTSSRRIDMTPERGQPSLAKSKVRWMPKLVGSRSVSSGPILFGKNGKGWSKTWLPVELFERVIEGVSRDDVLNLRLVSKEFEKKVSRFMFKAVVVPFRPQIYRNVATDYYLQENPISTTLDSGMIKDKGKVRATEGNEGLYCVSYNATDAVYDGMKVFEAWGEHVRKFAMTFDIDQDMFQKPPIKGVYDNIQTFWGSYLWPSQHYIRYESCEDQEKRADETRLMTVALSNLSQATELGLSVDNGLGWITGPDSSDRSRIFHNKARIFGRQHLPSELETLQRNQIWEALTAHIDFNKVPIQYSAQGAGVSPQEAHSLCHLIQVLHPNFTIPKVPIYSLNFPPLIFEGVDLDDFQAHPQKNVTSLPVSQPRRFLDANLVPNRLKPAQKEWLLENYWAQLAFLTSWSLAVADNAATFRNVRTLTVAHLSSKYLHTLQRQDIWTTLENLDSLVLMLSPDWRDVTKDDDGSIETPQIRPSKATSQFHEFLKSCIVSAHNITKLEIGFVGGGERAHGLHARNKHVLPAPVMDIGHQTGDLISVLMLPHVRHLTLSNCWITPDALKDFAMSMSTHSLVTLVLDSVSLTAPLLRIPNFSPEAFNPLMPIIGLGIHRYIDADGLISLDVNSIRTLLFSRGVDTTLLDGRTRIEPEIPDWFNNNPARGSWPEVINTITPGETLGYKRHLNGYLGEKAELKPRSTFRQTQFISCGYVRLPFAQFDQTSIGGTIDCCIPRLRKRWQDLANVMMYCNFDQFLGKISPTIKYEEVRCLVSAFGMNLGWPDDDDSKYDFREDGQPLGGSGRFSGTVEQCDEFDESGQIHGLRRPIISIAASSTSA